MVLSMLSSVLYPAYAGEIFASQDAMMQTMALESEDVVEISTADELIELANIPSAQQTETYSKHYKLMNDIDLKDKTISKSMKPIGGSGYTGKKFSGTFDGNDYSIINLEFNAGTTESYSLFYGLSKNAVVKNLNIKDASLNLYGGSGAIAAKNEGTITNCSVTDSTISGTSAGIGGLVGVNEGTIEKSFVENSSIICKSTYSVMHYGGLAGKNGSSSANGIIRESYADVSVDGKKSTGGLVGYSSGTIENCYTLGEVNGTEETGGLTGRAGSKSQIINSYVNATVISSNTTGSAIVGSLEYGSGGTVENAYYNSDKVAAEVNTVFADFVTGKTSDEMKTPDFVSLLNEGSNIWGIKSGINGGFPYLTSIGSEKEPENPKETIEAQFIVAPYDNEKYEFYMHGGKALNITAETDGTSAKLIEIMEEAKDTIPYTSSEGQYGTIIDSIFGIEAKAPAGWMFTINDKVSGVGVSNAIVKDGDKILWYYASPSNGYNGPKWDELTAEEDGEESQDFEGKGTKDEPYLIKAADDLKNIMKYPTANFKLNNPIDLDGVEFEPIGSLENPFRGTFDGNNYKISNFALNKDENSKNIGFFGVINNAKILNVKMENADVTGGSRLGILAGYAKEDSNGANLIANCHVSGRLTALGTDVIKTTHAGGLVGINDGNNTVPGTGTGSYVYSIIDKCSADVDVRCSDKLKEEAGNIGGLVGWNRGIITDSYSTGNVSGGNLTGGMVGSNWEQIYNSYSTGNVTGYYTIGGFAGSSSILSVIEDCYSTGNVVGDKISRGNNFGGFIGSLSGAVKNSLSTGTLIEGWSYNGGFAGTYDGYNINNDVVNSYGNSVNNLGVKIKGIGNAIDTEDPDYERYLKTSITFDESKSKLKTMFNINLNDADNQDNDTVKAEAEKYEKTVIIPKSAVKGENITPLVVKLKNSQSSDNTVNIIYGQKEYKGYVTDSVPAGQYTLINKNEDLESKEEKILLTFVKNGEFAVKEVRVILEGENPVDLTKPERIELSFPGGAQVTPLNPGGKQIISAKVYNGLGEFMSGEKVDFESSDPNILKHSFLDTFTAGEVTKETEVTITSVLRSNPEIKSSIIVKVSPKHVHANLDEEIDFLKQCYEAFMTEDSSGNTGNAGLDLFAPGAARLAGMDVQKIKKNLYIDDENKSAFQLSKSIITLIGADSDPRQYQDKASVRNLVQELVLSQQSEGANAGEFVKSNSDKNSIESLVRSVIALDMAGAEYDEGKAVLKLIEIYDKKDSHTFKDIKTDGLVLAALSNHKDVEGISAKINDILAYLKTRQNADGGFDIESGAEKGKNSPTATGRVILGLIANGINPLEDEEWIKNGSTMLDAIVKSKTVKENMKHSGYGRGEEDEYTYDEATGTAFGALMDLKNQKSMFELLKINMDAVPDRVEIDTPQGIQVEEGEFLSLTASVYDSDGNVIHGKELVWSSSDESIAAVTDGKAEAIRPGEATITVTVKDTQIKDTISITVTQKVTEIEIDTAIIVINEDDSYQVKSVPKTVTIEKGKHDGGFTAFGALQATTDQFVAKSSGWVTSIYGITGPETGGWMFSVNGVISNVGAKSTVVNSGDKVIWFCIYDVEKGNNPKWEDINAEPDKEYDVEEAVKALRAYYSKKSEFTAQEALGYLHTSGSHEDDLKTIQLKFKVNESPESASEYAKNIMGLIASGQNPYSYKGIDYVTPLRLSQNAEGKFIIGKNDNYPTTMAYSMMALDMSNAPYDTDKALSGLMSYQAGTGSFGGVDETGMVLSALSKYKNRTEIDAAIGKALNYLHSEQDESTGGFIVWGSESENPYSASAVIQGLVSVGENPESEEWTKNDKNILDSLMKYFKGDHFEDSSEKDMITEQGFMALADMYRGKSMFNEIRLNTAMPVKLVINGYDGVIREGDTVNLNVVAYDKDNNIVPAGELIWSSSQEDVAAADNQGKVTAKKPGEAVITASIKDTEISASLAITVAQKEINVEYIGDITIKNGKQVTTKVAIENLTEKISPATLIIALYDNNSGRMINYSVISKDLAGKEKLELSAGFLVPDTGSYSVKAFLWDDLENQNVIMNEYVDIKPAA
jgi:hypothetical protein